MTILAIAPVRRLAYRGYDDPSLPLGIWWGSGTVVGDASAGQQFVRIQMSEEGQAVDGLIYNLEQFSMLISEATDRDAFVRTTGLAPQSGLPAFDRIWHVRLQELEGVGNTGVGEGRPQLPLLLGTKRGGADALASLDIGTANLTASNSVSASALGYVWGPRSILAPGGPQRPARSLFGGN